MSETDRVVAVADEPEADPHLLLPRDAVDDGTDVLLGGTVFVGDTSGCWTEREREAA